jgi:hypothetical protein
MFIMLLTDPRFVISVRSAEAGAMMRDFYVIEYACYDFKLEPYPADRQKVLGTYRAVRGDRIELERIGLCDYAPARALTDQLEDRSKTPNSWNTSEDEVIMYVIHAASLADAMKQHPFGNTVLHQTPRDKLDWHRDAARSTLENREDVLARHKNTSTPEEG